MSKIYRVSGRICWRNSAPAAGIQLLIVDDDPLVDDVIAAGASDNAGRFCSSFAREAFNQEPLECERSPDIYIVASVLGEQGLVPIARFSFPPSTERDRDLGTLSLPLQPGQRPKPRARLPWPALLKRARRVAIDRALLADVVDEMSSAVGRLTGWGGLARGIDVDVVEDLKAYNADRLLRFEPKGKVDAVRRAIVRRQHFEGVAMYDAFEKKVVIDRSYAETQGLDVLKVIVGHELVHVGQYREHPQLLTERETLLRQAWEDIPVLAGISSGTTSLSADVLARARDQFRFQANIEGYATYIEQKLRKIYTCSSALPHRGFMVRIFSEIGEARRRKQAAEQSRAALRGVPLEICELEGRARYSTGLDAYLGREDGGQSVPFDPSFKIEPRGLSPQTISEIKRRAQGGSIVDQADLGLILTKGHGLPRDPIEGEKWLRVAAENGHLGATNNLAVYYLVPRGAYADAFRFLMPTAEAGFPSAQAEIGKFYLKGLGVAHDPVKANEWLHRSAQAGCPEGQHWYGVMLCADGQPEAGKRWLGKAAAQGHPEARATLAKLGKAAAQEYPEALAELAKLKEKQRPDQLPPAGPFWYGADWTVPRR